MWDQVNGVQEIIAPITANATDGVILICYSQGMYTSIGSAGWYLILSAGGLICRGFLEAFPDHNVKTFIGLSSPLAGQFGGRFNLLLLIDYWTEHDIFPDTDYFKFFPNFTRDNLYL